MNEQQRKEMRKKMFIEEIVIKLETEFSKDEINFLWNICGSLERMKTEEKQPNLTKTNYNKFQDEFELQTQRFREIDYKYKNFDFLPFNKLKKTNWEKTKRQEQMISERKINTPVDIFETGYEFNTQGMFQIDKTMRKNHKLIQSKFSITIFRQINKTNESPILKIQNPRYFSLQTDCKIEIEISIFQIERKCIYKKKGRIGQTTSQKKPEKDTSVPKYYLERLKSIPLSKFLKTSITKI